MWSIRKPRPLGGASSRRITLFVSAIVLALFATLIVGTPFTHAQTATQPGNSFEYDGWTYTRSTASPNEDDNIPNLAGTACETSRNVYYTPPATNAADPNTLQIRVICFASGTTDATLLVFGDAPKGTSPSAAGWKVTAPQKITLPTGTTASSQAATWSGDNLQLDGWTYSKSSAEPNKDPNIPNLAGTACENSQNIYYTPPATNAADPNTIQIRVICFEGDASDKSQPISATLLVFGDAPKGTSPSAAGWKVTDPQAVTITSGTSSTSANSTTTCDSKFTHGIGWIICPVTSFLADTMDRLYRVLISFLTVTPLSTDKTGPLYYAWGIMRNIANILFIIGFLIIIYSQITNTGMSSHSMKRLLPRLVIAAVLVNISYWLVAVAVDLSNILGVTLKDIFDQVGENIKNNANPVWKGMKWSDFNWQNLAGFALSGGAATFALASFGAGIIATAGGSIWLILVTLAGLMVSALVAILVLAARQALITIFIVISPLAFVAYLLPSTEKYFHRWRELFTTMLLIFPIFSVVFGAAHLAGMLIIYNANPGTDDQPNPNFLNVLVLGMAVQVAPLIITPLLVRVSGSLLGRIAGIVNDPNKGIVDGTRKFAEGRRDRTKYRRISDRDKDGNLKYNNPLAWGARKMAIRDAAMKQQLHSWEGAVEAEAANDGRVHEAHRQHELNELRKNTGESESKYHFNEQLAHSEMLRRMYYNEQKTKEQADAAVKNIATQYEGLKANPEVIGTSEAEKRIGEEAKAISDEAKGLAYREAAAKQIIDKNYHELLAKNKEMQEFAGFSAVDPYGASRVKNLADENEFKAREARIAASNAAMGRQDATIEEMQGVILGNAKAAGRFADFVNDADSRSAALRRLQKEGPMFAYQQIQEALDLSSNASSDVEKILRSEMASALKDRKIFYISNTHRTEMLEGKLDPKYLHEAGRDLMIKETLDLSGLGADAMVSVDRDELKAVRDYLRKHKLSSLSPNAQKSLVNSIELAFKDDRYSGRMGKSRTELNEIREELGLGRID